MFSIFKRVKAVFNKEYNQQSEDFKKGFGTCFQLFEIGYERTHMYNTEKQIQLFQREVELLNIELERAKADIKRQQEFINDLMAIEPDQLTPLFAKQKTVMKIVDVLNSQTPEHERIIELKKLFSFWNMHAFMNTIKRAG